MINIMFYLTDVAYFLFFYKSLLINMKRYTKILTVLAVSFLLLGYIATTIDDFFLPGSQPGQSGNLESPNKCDNCHGSYDLAVEPAFNWRGSMMSQAMRDPLYLASVVIANQDATESGDLCIRCHAPDGWLNGRSTPTDGSALNNNDRQGVQCDFCHKLVRPSELGVNPYPGDADYLSNTYDSDQSYLNTLTIIPPQSGNGMFIAHSDNAKRGPFVDAAAKHQVNYSPLHSESDICATCHDVSNPAFKKEVDADGNFIYVPDLNAATKTFVTYDMFPVERTYSEWSMSAYNTEQGVASDVFSVFDASGNETNLVKTCQDCHMQDVYGKGANKRGTPIRYNLPLHDMTGGNTFVPGLVAQLYPDEVDPAALEAGVARARFMLQNAATMNLTTEIDEQTGQIEVYVQIVNETGHKLPSGYPEGRRMWINLSAYDIDGNLISESGAYNYGTGALNKEGAKIYESKLGMSEDVAAAAAANESGPHTYIAGESFHFALNNVVIKDNRIPPRGFTNANFRAIQSPVVDYAYEDGEYFDTTEYYVPAETYRINVKLLYQTTSKEYVEFLRDENVTDNAGQLMYDLWLANGMSTPEVMAEQDEYMGDPPTPTVEHIKVRSIDFSRSSGNGGRTILTATVTVEDEEEPSNTISGAEVFGQFSGPTSPSVSGTTDEFGVVTFTTSSKKLGSNWCLEITNIIKEGYDFIATPMLCEGHAAYDVMTTINTNMDAIKVFSDPSHDLVNIEMTLAIPTQVRIEIYDLAGRKINVLKHNDLGSTSKLIQWNTSYVPAGVYLLRFNYLDQMKTKIISIR